MSTKSRQVIWGGRIMGADIRAKGAREAAQKAIQEADRAEVRHGPSGWKATAGLLSPLRRSAATGINGDFHRFTAEAIGNTTVRLIKRQPGA